MLWINVESSIDSEKPAGRIGGTRLYICGGNIMINSLAIKNKAIELGADLVGLADLGRVNGIPTEPKELLESFTNAVVIAVAISPEVFEQIKDGPTPLYVHHYQAANNLLDTINLQLQREILHEGFRALAKRWIKLIGWVIYRKRQWPRLLVLVGREKAFCW